jgi:hypothetical protein
VSGEFCFGGDARGRCSADPLLGSAREGGMVRERFHPDRKLKTKISEERLDEDQIEFSRDGVSLEGMVVFDLPATEMARVISSI